MRTMNLEQFPQRSIRVIRNIIKDVLENVIQE